MVFLLLGYSFTQSDLWHARESHDARWKYLRAWFAIHQFYAERIDPPFNFHVNFAAIACPCRFLLFSWRLFRLEIAMMYRTPRKDASVDAIVRQPSQCFSWRRNEIEYLPVTMSLVFHKYHGLWYATFLRTRKYIYVWGFTLKNIDEWYGFLISTLVFT